jgi:hypothetical protein
LAQALNTNTSLEQLNLSFNGIGCARIIIFAQQLPNIHQLRKLSLKPNPWWVSGKALKHNVSIEYLDSLLMIQETSMLRYYTVRVAEGTSLGDFGPWFLNGRGRFSMGLLRNKKPSSYTVLLVEKWTHSLSTILVTSWYHSPLLLWMEQKQGTKNPITYRDMTRHNMSFGSIVITIWENWIVFGMHGRLGTLHYSIEEDRQKYIQNNRAQSK